MSKHTPGPWKVTKDLQLRPGGSLAITAKTGMGTQYVIAEVWTCDDAFSGLAVDEPIGKENANLIASAPLGLELAEMVLAIVVPCSRANLPIITCERLEAKARELLAVAKGERP